MFLTHPKSFFEYIIWNWPLGDRWYIILESHRDYHFDLRGSCESSLVATASPRHATRVFAKSRTVSVAPMPSMENVTMVADKTRS